MAKKLGITILVIVALSALGYFVTTGIVKPIGSDLSVIGQGKPALVLAYENFSPTSGAALDRLRQVRSDYEPRLLFVVADLGAPQGRAFASRFGLSEGQTVFLSPDGQALFITYLPSDEQELRALLDDTIAAMGS
ncbi:MAG: hypothetical protein QNJ91_02500 [Gammaproteobacteria bacterium]|nr:hypothetical protein [Gammaproteobacteria bacterium]